MGVVEEISSDSDQEESDSSHIDPDIGFSLVDLEDGSSSNSGQDEDESTEAGPATVENSIDLVEDTLSD